MTARLRLILLVVALAYCAVFGPAHAQGGGRDRTHAVQAHKRHMLQLRRIRAQRRVRAQRRIQSHLRAARRLAELDTVGVRAVRFARHLLGTPYRYGGDSPRTGFDCSGFVRFVYQRFGIALPHSSYADFDLGVRVSRGSLRPGDLVFFDGVGHVGLYVGGNRFIHAPHTGTSVQVTSMSEPWYASNYDGARRLLTRGLRVFGTRRTTG